MMRRAIMALALIAAPLTTACIKRVVESPTSAGMGPTLVVEQFLRAANAQEWATLGTMFGTKDGPISKRDNKNDVEKRMSVIGRELHHDDYQVVGEQAVPGRSDATTLTVQLVQEGKKTNIPFTLVRYK
ncbi:MAG TPA: hypothetical protein VM100_04275, partial [Longimicrobiales bacterium]|nr:hypothetical protein [Longimicrobiales bacterium]